MQDALLNGATYNPLEALRRRADKENRFPNRRLKAWDLTPTEAIITVDPSKKTEDVEKKDQEDATASVHSVVINDVESTLSPTGTYSARGSPATLHVITETASIDEKEVPKKRHSGFHLPKLFKKKQSVTASTTSEKKVQEAVSVSPTVVQSRPKTPVTATASDAVFVSSAGVRPSSSDDEALPNPAVSISLTCGSR